MSVWPVAFSLMASFMSAITLMGVASENYMYGTQFLVINLSYVIATPIAAYVYLPVFHKQNSLSVYEYLEHRFGQPTRVMASIAFSIQMILYMGIGLCTNIFTYYRVNEYLLRCFPIVSSIVRSSVSPVCSNWTEQSRGHFERRLCMYILFHHWWHEGCTSHRPISGKIY